MSHEEIRENVTYKKGKGEGRYDKHNLKVSHPRCVVKIQVREENPILYSHKTQLNIKLSLL